MHILSSISSTWIGPWLPCSPHFTPSFPSLTVQSPNAPLPGFSQFRSLAEMVFFSHADDAFHSCIQCDDFRFCLQIHLLSEALIQLSPQYAMSLFLVIFLCIYFDCNTYFFFLCSVLHNVFHLREWHQRILATLCTSVTPTLKTLIQ